MFDELSILNSEIWPVVVAALLFILVFLTRLPWVTELGSDYFTQLWFQQQFRQSKKWIRPTYSDSVFKESVSFYPPFPSSLLARLPSKWVVPVGILSNYTLDALTALCIYKLLRWQDIDPVTALLGASLWACLPILHPVNARLIGIGARTLGPFLFFLWLLCVFFAINQNWFTGFVAMLLVSTLIVLSSQMALQNMLLHSLFLSILYLDPFPLLSGFGGIAIACLIGMRETLTLKFVYIRWYINHGRKFLSNRNSWGYLKSIILKKPLQILPYFFSSTTIGILFIGFIGLLPFSPYVNSFQKDYDLTAFFYFCTIVSASAVIFSTVTMKGLLEVFGESERYLEYVSPLIIIGIILYLKHQNIVEATLLGLVLCLCGIFFNLILYRIKPIFQALTCNNSFADIDEVKKILEPLGNRRIATSPLQLASKLSISLSDSSKYCFLHILLIDRDSGELHWPTNIGRYPYLDTRLEFLNLYEINTVIFQRSHLKNLPEETDEKQLKGWSRRTTDMFEIFVR